jgi:hypothetical protein
MDRRQEIIDHYEKIRKAQKESGTYNPYINDNHYAAPDSDNRNAISFENKVKDTYQKYLEDPTLI